MITAPLFGFISIEHQTHELVVGLMHRSVICATLASIIQNSTLQHDAVMLAQSSWWKLHCSIWLLILAI